MWPALTAGRAALKRVSVPKVRPLGSLSSTLSDAWEKWGGWVVLLVAGYIVFSFRGVFQAFGDAGKAAADDITAGVKQKAELAVQRKATQSATGSKLAYTDAQLTQFAQDAESLAMLLGHGPAVGLTDWLTASAEKAFGLVKKSYSFYNLHHNLPWVWGKDAKGAKAIVVQNAVTKDSQRNNINWKVLIAPYRSLTTRSLEADLRAAFSGYALGSNERGMVKWVLGS